MNECVFIYRTYHIVLLALVLFDQPKKYTVKRLSGKFSTSISVVSLCVDSCAKIPLTYTRSEIDNS